VDPHNEGKSANCNVEEAHRRVEHKDREMDLAVQGIAVQKTVEKHTCAALVDLAVEGYDLRQGMLEPDRCRGQLNRYSEGA
jgi:hypothetical protein